MFQFPAFAYLTVWYVFNIPGCPIRKSADRRLFAPTRSLSQLITSFIASESPGIHHTPLFIYSNSTNLAFSRDHILMFISIIFAHYCFVEFISINFQHVKELLKSLLLYRSSK